jgi:hypothetical protein
MSESARLSKSRFTAGLQCHRQLWWRVHEPDAPELVPDAATQAVFDQGTRVGELARSYVPGGTLVDLPHRQLRERVAMTEAALGSRTPAIYEASFFADRVFVAVDILERRGSAWRIVEVKSTTKLKDEHVPDAAVQAHVLRRAGLEVASVELMHLDRECRFPHLESLFAREDITAQVDAALPAIPALVSEQLAMLDGPLPAVAIGAHCSEPYECPFRSRCWAGLPEHHVTTMYFAGRKAWAFEAAGYRTVMDVPEAECPTAASRRQRRALLERRRIVEPTLAAALAALRGPFAFLDFETVAPAVPMWEGCRPYDAVPAQFSCHREDGRGGHEHREWLAEEPGDPREPLAHALIEACAGAASIVTYNVAFERRCVRELARHLGGERARALADIDDRLVDLLPLVRDHVYDPAFGGSFSLKAVLPALVSNAGYDDLAVREGTTASAWLERLVREDAAPAPAERARMATALKAYCKLDTWATVLLLRRLRELAAGA